MTQFFITDNRPNVSGLVLAGSADFKNELNGTDMFDPRLACIVVKVDCPRACVLPHMPYSSLLVYPG
jgi:peptide subunit release factor 1 (eRF1)